MTREIIKSIYSHKELTGKNPIITVSRNTDIPAFYSDWFLERIDAGFVDIPKRGDDGKLSRISLKWRDVSGYVFWTKNPKPMMPHLDELKKKCRSFYFHYTLNGYGQEIETNLPDWQERVETFLLLSKSLAHDNRQDKVIWRYDPIFLNDKYTKEWHLENFARTAAALKGATTVCVASFIHLDNYTVRRRMDDMLLHEIDSGMKIQIMRRFKEIATEYGIQLTSCSEVVDMSACGIEKAHCISDKIFDHYCLVGWPDAMDSVGIDGIIDKPCDRIDGSFRPFCECVTGVDIGVHGTCGHGCIYCSACDDNTQVFNVRGKTTLALT